MHLQFPDFPWPPQLAPSAQYATAGQLQEYVKAYADYWKLNPHIKLQCEVVHLSNKDSKLWSITYRETDTGNLCKMEADFVVMCTGKLRSPYIPALPGQSQFKGVQLHSSTLADSTWAQGKRVLVIGDGQEAMDCAQQLAVTQMAKTVTMVYRQVNWASAHGACILMYDQTLGILLGLWPSQRMDGYVAATCSMVIHTTYMQAQQHGAQERITPAC